MRIAAFYLWQDRRGRFSWLRAAALLALVAPAAVVVFDAAGHGLGARPLTEAIHRTGLWAIRFLMVSLAVTPFRRSLGWPGLLDVRRMIGVAACLYGIAHIALYAADQSFHLGVVLSEILHRLYLTIGAAALIGLVALAATSTDGMMRRLGGKAWRRLHQLIHPIALLALVHYFMQSKLNVTEPTVVAGCLLWLLLYRVAVARLPRRGSEPSPLLLAGLALLTGALTGIGEAAGYQLVYHVPALRVLTADLSFRFGPRPGWIVLGAGIAVMLLTALRRLAPSRRARPAE